MNAVSATITLIPWKGAPGSRPSHDARSPYVERCWLPILGPSTLLFLRFAVEMLDDAGEGASLALGEIARALGLGGRAGDTGPFLRMLSRAVDFHVAKWVNTGTVAVRRDLPELSPRQLERAPEVVRTAHRSLRRSDGRRAPDDEHALRLAQALAALGETSAEIERQLRKWQFPPTTARVIAERADPLELPPLGPARPSVRAGRPMTVGAALGVSESH